jgi:hypothetical protein
MMGWGMLQAVEWRSSLRVLGFRCRIALRLGWRDCLALVVEARGFLREIEVWSAAAIGLGGGGEDAKAQDEEDGEGGGEELGHGVLLWGAGADGNPDG